MATIATLIATAQNLPIIPVGIIQNGSEFEILEAPKSTILVDISVTTTKFTAGIYARYAQKYLGERATLSNRQSATIDNVTVAIAPQDYFVSPLKTTPPSTKSTTSPLSTISSNITSADVTIPETAAANIAEQIFANRKLCQDLIAGNIGEGVFGAGLTAALERMDRMEKEYITLFMGSEETTTSTQRFTINLKANTKRYMICRYDPNRGILSANEIDGDPIYLQITPEILPDTTYKLAIGKFPKEKSFVAANRAQCDLYVGANIVATSQLPLYEFGRNITIVYDPK